VKIVELRERQQRNFLATLLLSQGVPMFCGGDEIGRTQQGNNNAYCQDNEISWVDWTPDAKRRDLLAFTRYAARLRRRHPVFRRRQFFFGRPLRGSDVKDLTWFRCDGGEMTQEDWTNAFTRCFGVRLAGDAIVEQDAQGRRIVDDTFLVMLNAHHEPMGFTLPTDDKHVRWDAVLDTREPTGRTKRRALRGGDVYEMEARSLAVLRLARDGREDREDDDADAA
jgi:isoamylase